MRSLFFSVLSLALLSGCSLFSGGSKTANDQATKIADISGSKVCISDLVGVRYSLEDELERQKLEPEADCMFADIQVQEQGAPSSWVLRYQRVGDGKWQECRSEASQRGEFARQCIRQMRDDLGRS
jgi:hypothetical protein